MATRPCSEVLQVTDQRSPPVAFDHPDVHDAGNRSLLNSEVFDCGGACVAARTKRLVTVVVVNGEIDMSNADRFAEVLSHLSQQECPLLVDMSEVTFLAGAALRVLLAFGEDRDRAGQPWALVNGGALRPLLRVVPGLEMRVVESVASAIQRFAGRDAAKYPGGQNDSTTAR